VISWHDLRERRIPNAWVAVAALAGVVAGVVAQFGSSRQIGVSMLAGTIVAGLPMLLVHLATPATLGFGDVKYASAVGIALGVLDWRLAAGAILVATVLGASSSFLVPPWRRSIPLGFLIAAAGTGMVGAAGILM
jgi:leader peptidase (prepilin peptidase) / N-methyltransferase